MLVPVTPTTLALTFLLFEYLVLAINADVPSVYKLITTNGYPAEVHYVTTSDGYILKMHRIPHGRNTTTNSQKPVLVLHGILLSSAVFIMGDGEPLGYSLADDGYDVWLGNVRGNSESRNHTSLDPNGAKFWNFSWHEMGTEDLPAMVDYVLKTTSQKELFYIGHSEGTTVLYVMLTECPEYNKKIKAHFSLAPIAFFDRKANIILDILAEIATSGFVKLLDIHEFFSKNQGFASVFYTFIFVGILKQGSTNVNNTVFSVMAQYFPAGCSMKNVIHYAQEVNSGYFRQYDYGKKNTEVYGSSAPLSYNLTLITAPGYFFYGSKDKMSAKQSVDRLCDDIGDSCVEKFVIPEFRHMDYIINKKASNLVYSKIFELMNKN